MEQEIAVTGTLSDTPEQDGYYMPGEFEPHAGCILIWPERPGSWSHGAVAARRAFCAVIAAIAESERVFVAVSPEGMPSAKELLFANCVMEGERDGSLVWDETHAAADAESSSWRRNVEIFPAETDDAWARDVAPTFVKKRVPRAEGETEEKARDPVISRDGIRAVNWEFNAWGGIVDGLYASWEKDNAFAKYFAGRFGYECYDAAPFVLEGGSIHSDGEGTVLVTESCLLSAGRNPQMSREDIEERLEQYLGARKVLWLPRGIYLDETNEHVDNVCAFLRPGEVVLAWTDREDDPQYALSKQCLDYLESVQDARGRQLIVHRLPIPDVPVCITEEELSGYVFETGEDEREVGERLAASYVNFYFSNGAVVMPVFGGENEDSDRRAVSLMEQWNPGRKVIPVYARAILAGGGNIHCITQQLPI